MNVLLLKKRLTDRPRLPIAAPVEMGRLQLRADVDAWLALRQRAFRDETPQAGEWTMQDALRELRCDRDSRRITWLARLADEDSGPANTICGAVSLSCPGPHGDVARLHWLMVDPDWRRRGVGSLLLATAEGYSWDHGWHEVRLETHAGWTAAVQFYKERDYHEARSVSEGSRKPEA